MALESLCGVPRNFGFGQKSETEDDLLNYVDKSCGNLFRHTELALPPLNDPSTAYAAFNRDAHGNRISIKFNKGTTTLAFQYRGGVVVAVDSRATGGSFI
ncbi:proteasome subunit beta type-8-like, partial [Stegodyphus dumicola]|uniref:proteasome subunit beta type-8-like n=1 Tax=Stegodyphus dumicola TaxID=202533 RepID=UPI0015A9B008